MAFFLEEIPFNELPGQACFHRRDVLGYHKTGEFLCVPSVEVLIRLFIFLLISSSVA